MRTMTPNALQAMTCKICLGFYQLASLTLTALDDSCVAKWDETSITLGDHDVQVRLAIVSLHCLALMPTQSE